MIQADPLTTIMSCEQDGCRTTTGSSTISPTYIGAVPSLHNTPDSLIVIQKLHWYKIVYTNAIQVPNGNHGLFHRFNIEALTLEGRDASDPGQPPRIHSLHQASFHRLGITLESILRSLNNLLERFHQSYFFYMLAATNRFISIGQYMPSLCLLCGAMLIRALSLWVTLQKDDEKDEAIGDTKVAEKDKIGNNVNDKAEGDDEKIARETDAKELTKEETQEITKDIDKDKSESVMRGTEDKVANITKDKYIGKEQTENNAEEKEELKNSRVNGFSIANVGGNYLLVHLMGYTVMNLPPLFTYIGAIHFSLASEVSVFYGMLSSSAIFILLSPKCLRTPSELTRDEVTVVNILMLIELSTACLAIGVHNFPLGVCLAALYTPLALIVGVVEDKKQGRLILFVKRVVCLLLQPLLILMILMILYSRVLFPEEGIFLMASRGKDAAMQAIMFSIVDSMIYGNWLFNIVCTVILPTWILSWQILWNRVQV
nr:uncharacterized protein LOC116775428 [Danaus plexippus plexippus]